ncbi:hypothetical protein DC366_13080 [Pelagivirga sediminicola]|uniref:DUF304 domain-containing protein n=1 Tax=Pelagivirga sediminicola TaxID=2170575 RepID=A0A2T7G5J0_9RHOB|nr:hypothetical protein [Pelagivirga sediminicola]PVA09681.1 hypothetical protein DC366_13080 [Pelagivirga sediminicola]
MSEIELRQSLPPLAADETVRQTFRADRGAYWRDHAWMAAAAMAAGMAILAALGNPHVWTGAVGGLAAIALRAFYLSTDALKSEWQLTDRRLLGPGPTAVALSDIGKVRGIGSAVQVITRSGDKYLLKFLPDRSAAQARIASAAGVAG